MQNSSSVRAGLALFLLLLVQVGSIADETVPRSEHPNPQLMRNDWVTLNGTWEFAETDDDEQYLGDTPYPDKIIVPFCRESALSGLARKGFVNNVWYRRTLAVPDAWKDRRVLLHIGACDFTTTIFMNDKKVLKRSGGNTPITADITEFLKEEENALVVHAFDDVRSGLQPGGKQSPKEESFGCLYTRTTGIWQSVWMEAVSPAHIAAYRVIADAEGRGAKIEVELEGPAAGMTLRAQAKGSGVLVAEVKEEVGKEGVALFLPMENPRLWRVSDPYLYDLELTLIDGDKSLDTVLGYFGLRTLEIRERAFLINGEPVFQRLVLDQGFYPDGIWTAPSEEALKGDIELSMAAGFNGARLHQKVFEPRFLYWADRLGYLVWGEYPNWGLNYGKEEGHPNVLAEWKAIVERDFNHPSIIGWCPFNETDQSALPLQAKVLELVKKLDATRPVLETSGWTHGYSDPQLLDNHDYDQDPSTFKSRWIAAMQATELPQQYGGVRRNVPFFISEYGGIGWNIDKSGWGYGNAPETIEAFYERHAGLTKALLENRFMFGFCYTQLTDIEQEQNGIYTYQRQPKFDMERIRSANQAPALYESSPPLEKVPEPREYSVLVGGNPDGEKAGKWQYTLDMPVENWIMPEFDDSGWESGRGGFGNKEGANKRIRTPWRTENIWLRKKFEYDGKAFDKAILVMHHDDNAEVYLNGKVIRCVEKWNDAYEAFDVSMILKDAIKTGENLLAIHVRQDHGGQFIDAALLIAPQTGSE